MRRKRIEKKEMQVRREIITNQSASILYTVENHKYHTDSESLSMKMLKKENIKQMGKLIKQRIIEVDRQISNKLIKQQAKFQLVNPNEDFEENRSGSDQNSSGECKKSQVKDLIKRFQRQNNQQLKCKSHKSKQKFERKKCALEQKIKSQIQTRLNYLSATKTFIEKDVNKFQVQEEELSESSSSNSISDGELSQFSEFAKQDFTYEINSDDMVEAKCVVDYGTPKYLGNQEDMEEQKRKQSIIHQINYASFLEIELYKLNIKLEIQQSKANEFVTSLNTDVIEKQILKISQKQKVSMMQKSIVRGYESLEKISQEESIKVKDMIVESKKEKSSVDVTKALKRKVWNKNAGLTDGQKIEQMQIQIQEMQSNIERKYQAKQNILKKIVALGRAKKQKELDDMTKSPLIYNVSRQRLLNQTQKNINTWQRSKSQKNFVMDDDVIEDSNSQQ